MMCPHLRQRRYPRKETELRFQHEAVEARDAGLPLSPAEAAAVKAFDLRILAMRQRMMRPDAFPPWKKTRFPGLPVRFAARLEVLHLARRQSVTHIHGRRAGRPGVHLRAARRQRAKSRSPGRRSGPSDDDGPALA